MTNPPNVTARGASQKNWTTLTSMYERLCGALERKLTVLGLLLTINYNAVGWHMLILINVTEIFSRMLFFHPKEHFPGVAHLKIEKEIRAPPIVHKSFSTIIRHALVKYPNRL